MRPLVVLLAAAAAQSILAWLAHTLTAAHTIEKTLGDSFIKPLPVLLGDEDSSKHSNSKAEEGKGKVKISYKEPLSLAFSPGLTALYSSQRRQSCSSKSLQQIPFSLIKQE